MPTQSLTPGQHATIPDKTAPISADTIIRRKTNKQKGAWVSPDKNCMVTIAKVLLRDPTALERMPSEYVCLGTPPPLPFPDIHLAELSLSLFPLCPLSFNLCPEVTFTGWVEVWHQLYTPQRNLCEHGLVSLSFVPGWVAILECMDQITCKWNSPGRKCT